MCVVLLSGLALAGCSATPTAAPVAGTISDACRAALEEMAAAPDDVSMDDWNALGDAATHACPTAEEYLAGARAVPNSLWYSDSPIDDELVVQAGCLLDATTPMCVDAAKNGYDPTP